MLFPLLFFSLLRWSYSRLPRDMLCFYSGVQNGDFHEALRFQQGNWESLQTAEMGFVMVSHDITTNGASRDHDLDPLWGFSVLSHTQLSHRYDLTTAKFQVSPCCPPSPSRSLPLSHFNTLSAPTTPMSGSIVYHERASAFNEEMSQPLPLWDHSSQLQSGFSN